MKKIRFFPTVNELVDLINAYFAGVGIDAKMTFKSSRKRKDDSNTQQKPWLASAQQIESSKPANGTYDPPTLSGLAIFLGFDSIDDLDVYENRGKFPSYIRRARLFINEAYEKKLYNANASGAIFALKGMGRKNEKQEETTDSKTLPTLNIEVTQSGPSPATCEKGVIL